jgi:hypothetical protein
MIRRLNYTDRVRIRRQDVHITLAGSGGGLSFTVEMSKLTGYALPSDSLVFIEAYQQTNWMRFDFGRLDRLDHSGKRELSLFDTPEGIRFRLKITPGGESSRLLAEADGIPLLATEDREIEREHLLPVKPHPLGEEIWRVDFSSNYPVLLINNEAGNYRNIVKSDAFISLALPSIFREILNRIILVDKHMDDSDPDDWHTRWLAFTVGLHGVGEPPFAEDVEECSEWIDSAVGVFSRRNRFLGRFHEFWSEGS